MSLTADQVLALAPDSSSASAGKKLSAVSNWQNLGATEQALWGECKGSALYQTRVSRSDLAYKCSCPSRKLPCKHVLGLLLLSVQYSDQMSQTEHPEWVSSWLEKREASAEKKKAKAESAPTPADEKAAEKRAEKREQRTSAGLEQFGQWMEDIVGNGLLSVKSSLETMLAEQAGRLVDNQASGLASRLRELSSQLSSENREEVLVRQFGIFALLLESYKKIETLPPLLASDIRQYIGWNVSREDVIAHGDLVDDEWIVLAQNFTTDGKLRIQKTWLQGVNSGRVTADLQFSPNAAVPFGVLYPLFASHRAVRAFYPSANPQRSLLNESSDQFTESSTMPGGAETFETFFSECAEGLAKNPFTESFPAIVHSVRLFYESDSRVGVIDRDGRAVLFSRGDYRRLLLSAGGEPFTIIGEWSNGIFTPLSMFQNGQFRSAV